MTYRTTSLHIKRPWYNRLSWWLYDRLCGEPFIPEGRIIVTILRRKDKDDCRITFIPHKFIAGIHEIYKAELTIIDIRK